MLGIVADDLTGACDVAGAFAAHGWRSEVRLGTETDATEAAVVVYDADVRDASRRSSWQGFEGSVEAAERLAGRVHMLKIDSTLRGPIAQMVAMLLRRDPRETARPRLAGSSLHLGGRVALIAPAFPAQHRLLENGKLVSAGQPGHEPISLIRLLEDEGLKVARVPAATARAAGPTLEQAVLEAISAGAQAVVVDTDCEACLANAAAVWDSHRERLLLVGSAGVARHLAQRARRNLGASEPGSGGPKEPGGRRELGGRTRSSDRREPGADGKHLERGPVIVISGSPTSTTTEQLGHLVADAARQGVALRSMEVRPGEEEAAVEATLEGPGAAVICLRTGGMAPGMAGAEEGGSRDAGERSASVAVAASLLAERLRRRVPGHRHIPSGAMLIGGASTRAVLDRLGARGIDVDGELEPGVPFGALRGGLWDGLPVVTKAGGFGDPSAVVRGVEFLRRMSA